MKNFFQLIRYRNLLIIIATMLIMRFCVIGECMQQFQLSIIGFGLLVLATVCISAAGYIINDYFDVNADQMNKPEKVIVGNAISAKAAMIWYWVLNIVGFLCGLAVAYGIGKANFSFIFLFVAGILWFYSSTFSKEPLWGNLIIAILVAIVPLIEVLFEVMPLQNLDIDAIFQLNVQFVEILIWSFGYAFFAFILTFLREIVKDIEDVEGDKTYGRNTMPIAWGILAARGVAIAMGIITIIALVVVQILKLNDSLSLAYLNVCVTIPLIFTLIKFIKSDSAQQYAQVSFQLKLIMLTGIIFLIVKTL